MLEEDPAFGQVHLPVGGVAVQIAAFAVIAGFGFLPKRAGALRLGATFAQGVISEIGQLIASSDARPHVRVWRKGRQG